MGLLKTLLRSMLNLIQLTTQLIKQISHHLDNLGAKKSNKKGV